MPYGMNNGAYQQPPTNNNLWFGNNYASGYSQASRSMMNPMNQMNPNMMAQMPNVTPMQGMMNQPNQMLPVNNILRVMGPRSAQEYQIGPNSHVVLMDDNNPIMYQKRSDDSGYSETKAYEFHEIPFAQLLANDGQLPIQTDSKIPEYVTKAEFEEFKKSIEELVMSNA